MTYGHNEVFYESVEHIPDRGVEEKVGKEEGRRKYRPGEKEEDEEWTEE